MIVPMTFDRFRNILPRICCRDTSFDPHGWTMDNPFWGQCFVVSALAKSLFSGIIVGASLAGTKFAKLQFHFWNVFLNNSTGEITKEDFTHSQFGGEYPEDLELMQVDIASLFVNINTQRRYSLLQRRFAAEINK